MDSLDSLRTRLRGGRPDLRRKHRKKQISSKMAIVKAYLMSGGLEEDLINGDYGFYKVQQYALELEQTGQRQRPRDPDGHFSVRRCLDENGQKKLDEYNKKSVDYHREHYDGQHMKDGKRVKTLPGTKRPRSESNTCELCGLHCGSRRPAYHHWNNNNYLWGLYVCIPRCHHFVEVVDHQPGVVAKYLRLKADLDNLFADPITLLLAQKDWAVEWDRTAASFKEQKRNPEYHNLLMRRLYLGAVVDDKRVFLKLEHKRPYPGVCELCDTDVFETSKQLKYHHWAENPNKGLWLCVNCHDFAEVIDHKPHAETIYLKLKELAEEGVL